jgi:hypothetical protein
MSLFAFRKCPRPCGDETRPRDAWTYFVQPDIALVRAMLFLGSGRPVIEFFAYVRYSTLGRHPFFCQWCGARFYEEIPILPEFFCLAWQACHSSPFDVWQGYNKLLWRSAACSQRLSAPFAPLRASFVEVKLPSGRSNLGADWLRVTPPTGLPVRARPHHLFRSASCKFDSGQCRHTSLC